MTQNAQTLLLKERPAVELEAEIGKIEQQIAPLEVRRKELRAAIRYQKALAEADGFVEQMVRLTLRDVAEARLKNSLEADWGCWPNFGEEVFAASSKCQEAIRALESVLAVKLKLSWGWIEYYDYGGRDSDYGLKMTIALNAATDQPSLRFDTAVEAMIREVAKEFPGAIPD